ncbi:unnamed protein product, partial [Prorocentrum cordatum]
MPLFGGTVADLFRLVQLYVAKTVPEKREEGHLPCSDTWMLPMVSDFSQRLPPGHFSAWISRKGFLEGKFLLTRIPCALPSDIILLCASDCLRNQKDIAYENLAVMSADPSQSCSPASRMSGGDYDGDEVLIIGVPSLVESFQEQPEPDHHENGFGASSRIEVSSVLENADRNGQTEAEAMQEAVKSSFVQASRDAALTGTVNTLWLNSADQDISERGKFSERTNTLARLQEYALDAPKTGWTMPLDSLRNLECGVPDWKCKKRRRANSTNLLYSESALGQIHRAFAGTRGDPHSGLREWLRDKLANQRPPDCECHSLLRFAEAATCRLPEKMQQTCLQIFRNAEVVWNDATRQCRLGTARRTGGAPVLSWPQARRRARATWRDELHRDGWSPELFALTVYKKRLGDPPCWELCFEELCGAAAEHAAERPGGHVSVVSVAMGAAAVTLRGQPATQLQDGSRNMLDFGPAPPLVDLTRLGKVLRNLASMRGPADGGDLNEVPRSDPKMVSVDELRFTHGEISDHFKNGMTITDTVSQLENGTVSLFSSEFILDVVELEGKLYSIASLIPPARIVPSQVFAW